MAKIFGAAKDQIYLKFWSDAAEARRKEAMKRDVQDRLTRPPQAVDPLVPRRESPLSVSPYLLQPAKPRPKFFPGDCVIIDGAPSATVQKVTWTMTGWSYSLIDGHGEPVS